MIDKIRTLAQYDQVMKLIEKHLKKATAEGSFDGLIKKEKHELQQLSLLSLLASKYEDERLAIMPLPLTLKAVIAQKLQELNLTQVKLAELLGIGAAKLSQILNEKRPADVSFLKAVYKKLHIDAAFLLENA